MFGLVNAAGQAKPKSKPARVKRRRDVKRAENYSAVSGTLNPSPRGMCGSRDSLSETYYHSGTALYTQVGDYIYTERRTSKTKFLENGYYLVSHDGRTFLSISVDNGRVSSVENCR